MPTRDPARDAWDAGRDLWQDILNARAIPERRRQIRGTEHEIRARIEWERDGEEWITTRTSMWTRDPDTVLVQMLDPRWRTRGVWVGAEDVRRVGGPV